MRALTIGVVLLLAASVYADDKEKTEWQKVAPKGSGVEVQFPGKATGKETKAGTQYVLETMGGKGAYLLMTSPLPAKIDITNKDNVKKILDGGRDGGVKALKGKLVTDKDIKIGKFPGRAIDVDTDLGLDRSRVYLTETQMIQVIVFGPKKFSEGDDAKKFLDSLKISE